MKYKKNQTGIALLLAILILAAITALAFSLAGIVLIEIKSAGDVIRSEQAVYATLGTTEEALYQYRLNLDGTAFNVPSCIDADNTICRINGIDMTFIPANQPILFDTSPRIEFVANHTVTKLPMYLLSTFDQQYSSLEVKMFPRYTNPTLAVHLIVTPDDDTAPSTINGTVTESNSFTFNAFQIKGQYELVLDNSANNEDTSVAIATTRVNAVGQPQGLPFIGEQVLRIRANNLGLTRTYEVRIPSP